MAKVGSKAVEIEIGSSEALLENTLSIRISDFAVVKIFMKL